MQYALTLLALAAASVSAQTASGTPSGCSTNYDGSFEIAPVNVSSSAAMRKRDLEIRQATACTSNPIVTLKNGVLTDQNGRTGEIVANHQFQFDNPVQAGRLYDAGFSVCGNGSLAIGGNAVFYGCNSGSFANLYDQSLGGQCYQIYIDIIPCSGGSSSVASSSPATTMASSASSAPMTTMTTPYIPQMATVAPVSSAAPAPSVAAAPYPVVGNTTTAAAAGTASASAHPAASSPLTAPASGASAITVGSTFGVVAAAFIALAMF